MFRKWRRPGYLALTLGVLVGCEDAGRVAAPADEPAQAEGFAAFEASVVSSARASGIDLLAPAAEVAMSRPNNERRFVFVQGSVGDVAVEAVIGSAGGVLTLGNHWLLVPRNAVRGNVRFRMTPISDGTFHVDLTATQVGREENENDVGRSGFRTPVFLAFHFGDAHAFDPSSLLVAWLTNGSLITQQTFIHEQEWAVGVLRHFSGYVLVSN